MSKSSDLYIDKLNKEIDKHCENNDCKNCPNYIQCKHDWEDACAEEYFYYKERGLR
jgi:hypothetical protein